LPKGGVLVKQAQLAWALETGDRLKHFLRPLYLFPPVREDLRLAEAACDPVLIDDDGVIVACPQALALRDACVRGELDDRRLVISPPGVQLRIDDLLVVAPFLVYCAVLPAHRDRASRPAQHVHQADLLDAQIVPPEFSLFA